MKILLGSTNVSKQRSISIAMNELGFDDISVMSGTNMGEGSYPKVSTADDFYAQYISSSK